MCINFQHCLLGSTSYITLPEYPKTPDVCIQIEEKGILLLNSTLCANNKETPIKPSTRIHRTPYPLGPTAHPSTTHMNCENHISAEEYLAHPKHLLLALQSAASSFWFHRHYRHATAREYCHGPQHRLHSPLNRVALNSSEP